MLNRIFALLLVSKQILCQDIDEVIWTSEEQSALLSEEEHKVAFTDVVLESILKREIGVIVENSRLGEGLSRIPACLLFSDPMALPDISFSKSQTALFDIHFKAWDMKMNGLLFTKVKNLHVLRHLGLNDIRVVAQLVAPLTIEGKYSLTGSGLSLLPLTGNGNLSIKIKDFMLTAETYLVLRGTKLFIRKVDLKMTEKDMDVNLQNLMGDGLVGDVANSILDTIGEDVLFNNEHLLEEWIQTRVEREINNFLMV